MDPFRPCALPPAAISWSRYIPLLGKANRALAHFDESLNAIPNPDLLMAPLMTKEAVSSSTIEGTQATLGDVYRLAAGDAVEPAERREDIGEILNYEKALCLAEAELPRKPFNLNLLRLIHGVLMQGVRGRDKLPGRFRTAQNWIGRRGHGLEQAVYVPPVAAELMVYLHDWECYYHAEAPDPLVQLAIVHAQFELIHPFLDGNGRIGRILVPLFLFEKGLLGRPRFYLSTWLEAHRDEYVDRLHDLGQEDAAWDAWIEFFLTGIYEQAQANTQKVQAIRALYSRLQAEIIHLTKSAYAVPLLDSLFRTPIFSLPRLTFTGPRPSRPALNELLLKLKAAGIISVLEGGAGRRAALYTLRELFNLCEGEPGGIGLP